MFILFITISETYLPDTDDSTANHYQSRPPHNMAIAYSKILLSLCRLKVSMHSPYVLVSHIRHRECYTTRPYP